MASKKKLMRDYKPILASLPEDSHKHKILKHMIEHGSITQLEAWNRYDCMRLGARICELRHKGVNIETITVENIRNNGHHAKYLIEKKEDA